MKTIWNEFFFFIVRLVCEKCKFDICKEDDPNRFVEYFNVTVNSDPEPKLYYFKMIGKQVLQLI